jgi:hypothetical protein
MVSQVECKRTMIGPIILSRLVGVIVLTLLLSTATDVRSEVWICPQADGTEVYSDQQLNNRCRKMEKLPPLRRAPAVPSAPESPAMPQANVPAVADPSQIPEPGRGRQIDPPSNGAISIYLNNSALSVQNLDSDWTAQKLCLDLLYHMVAESAKDVHLKKCLTDLKPMETRKLSVSGLPSEATIDSVDWVK